MGLTKEQIVKILQVKGLGRKTAFLICESTGNEIVESDNDLRDFVLGCVANKWIRQLPAISYNDFDIAFRKANEILEKSDMGNVRVISYYDVDYPDSLKNIKDPPIILNIKGEYKELNKLSGIAIIGTRKPTPEGIQSGLFFGEAFGKEGFNIVSGLAIGCDAAAHKGCLKSKGFTTAILAHGLGTIYPKENKELAEDIISNGGVLLSEYFMGTGALSNFFVERDRLQAGLSKATLVIQSGISGGTMHAVNATLESNKILGAVKYSDEILSEKIMGNQMLINDKGAFGLTSKNFRNFLELLKNKPDPEHTNKQMESQSQPLGGRTTRKKQRKDNSDQYKIGF